MRKQKSVISNYLEKRALYGPLIESEIHPNIDCIIVIPSYNEPDLLHTLNDLYIKNDDKLCFEVIVVLNSRDTDPIEILDLHNRQLIELNELQYGFPIHTILLEKIPSKLAGVGYARKAGMDEAARRLMKNHADNGLIVCLDGDCEVSENYVTSIRAWFTDNPNYQAAHLRFEHRLPNDEVLRTAIIKYELHLRLMRLQIAESGHPQGFHAVGSSMVVRAWSYAAQGGMNKRQAGEDFYFIHKFSKIGKLADCTNAVVYPASRESSRVPFGTGAAIVTYLKNSEQHTYNPESYQHLKTICNNLDLIFEDKEQFIDLFQGFQADIISDKLTEIIEHTSSKNQAQKRFFHWFDAFQVIKFLHFLRDRGLNDIPVSRATQLYFEHSNLTFKDLESSLHSLRIIDSQPKDKV